MYVTGAVIVCDGFEFQTKYTVPGLSGDFSLVDDIVAGMKIHLSCSHPDYPCLFESWPSWWHANMGSFLSQPYHSNTIYSGTGSCCMWGVWNTRDQSTAFHTSGINIKPLKTHDLCGIPEDFEAVELKAINGNVYMWEPGIDTGLTGDELYVHPEVTKIHIGPRPKPRPFWESVLERNMQQN